MLSPEIVVDEFMQLVQDYVPDDVDEADITFALIKLESIGLNFYIIQWNVNNPKDFMPNVWIGNFVDIGQYDDIKTETEMTKFLFDEAVKYRESHLLKTLKFLRCMNNLIEW